MIGCNLYSYIDNVVCSEMIFLRIWSYHFSQIIVSVVNDTHPFEHVMMPCCRYDMMVFPKSE